MKNLDNNNNLFDSNVFHPAWVTGFVDGEGCFHISVVKHKDMKSGFQVQLQFSITQHNRDRELLSKFVDFFKGGTFVNDGPTKKQYRIRNIKQMRGLFDLFDKYPLLTQKKLDLECFRKAYELMIRKEHLTKSGLEEIIVLKNQINRLREHEIN